MNELDMVKWANGTIQRRIGAPCVLAVSIGRGGGWSSISGAQLLDNGDVLVNTSTPALNLVGPCGAEELPGDL